MLIRNSESTQKSNWSSCKVWEYEFENKDLWIAKAKITWRYPEKGAAMNTLCNQVYYVIWEELEVVLINSPAWSPDQYVVSE